MKDSLQETFYCDFGHPKIQSAAAGLKAGEEDPLAVAKRTFYFVRDEFPFGFDLYQRKASETLKRGHGVCWNKNLLLTALLRCNQIPARFCSVPLKRTFVKPAIGTWCLLANDPFNHCLVQVFLNSRWTMLDPTLDTKTYQAFFRPRGIEWGIDWNGLDDLRLYTESIVGEVVIHTDIDAALKEKMGNKEAPRLLALALNRSLNRKMWKRVGAHAAACGINRAALVTRSPSS